MAEQAAGCQDRRRVAEGNLKQPVDMCVHPRAVGRRRKRSSTDATSVAVERSFQFCVAEASVASVIRPYRHERGNDACPSEARTYRGVVVH